MFTNVAKLTRDGHYVTVSVYSKIHKKMPKTHETDYVYRKNYCNLFPNGECVMKNLKMCDIYY